VRKIVESFCDGEVAVIPQDSYYRDSSHIPVEERAKLNFDEPAAIEWKLLVEQLQQLKSGKAIEQPTYSYITCTRQAETIHLEPRDIIIVEDIVDSGMTLSFLKKVFATRNAASVRIATLLNKPARRRVDLDVEYYCFNIPDAFVVGYGLDYAEKYRNLPDIGVLHPRIYTKEE
jgi:hypoxanthine phosphoribosyltransferase